MEKSRSISVKVLSLFLLPLMLLLAGCENQTFLRINENDTYEIKAIFSQPKAYAGEVNCLEQIPELKTYLETPGVEVKDQSTAAIAKCVLLLKDQPISKAKAPFVTIKHYGDYYRVKLAPLQQLSFLGENSTFLLQLSFPGAVLKVDSEVKAKVEGNTVIWNSAEVLAKGFQVDGQDHAGWRTWVKALLLLLCVIALVFAVLFLGRKHPRIAPAWNYLRKWGRRFHNFLHYHWHSLMIKFDLASPVPAAQNEQGYSGKRVRQFPGQKLVEKLKAHAEAKQLAKQELAEDSQAAPELELEQEASANPEADSDMPSSDTEDNAGSADTTAAEDSTTAATDCTEITDNADAAGNTNTTDTESISDTGDTADNADSTDKSLPQ